MALTFEPVSSVSAVEDIIQSTVPIAQTTVQEISLPTLPGFPIYSAVSEVKSSTAFPTFKAVPDRATTKIPVFPTFPAVPQLHRISSTVFPTFKAVPNAPLKGDSKVKVEELLQKYMSSSKNSPDDIYEKTLDVMKALTGEQARDVLQEIVDGPKEELKQSGEKLRGRTRVPHFKHKKFSRYYRNLNLTKKTHDLPETAQKNILSSLREQLTASVLGNKKLRQKANHEPVYKPVHKVNRNRFKNYYKTKIAKMVMKDITLLPGDMQTKLMNELGESVFENLGGDLPGIGEEEDVKKQLQEDLKNSLKEQLLKVLG